MTAIEQLDLRQHVEVGRIDRSWKTKESVSNIRT